MSRSSFLFAIGVLLACVSFNLRAQTPGLEPRALDAAPAGPSSSFKNGKPWRVLTLTLVDPELPASLVFGRTFRDTLQNLAPGKVTYFSESVDAPNFNIQQMESEMVALYKKKYAKQEIDLVVGVSAEIAEFLEKYRNTLWPNAEIMFIGAHTSNIKRTAAISRHPYVAWDTDVHGTLELVQRLQPDARRLVVIGGTTSFDNTMIEDAKEALSGNTRWAVEYWTGYSQAELRERLAALPKDTAVIYTTLFKDAAGQTAYPRNALDAIAAQASVPVYGMFQTYIGHNLTAGSLVDFQDMGKDSAALALRVLKREQLPVSEMQSIIQSHCFADAKRVDSYGLSLKNLPSGCDIQNPLRNLWTDYKAAVLTAIAVILLQAITIGAMFWQKRRRAAAEFQTELSRQELRRAMRFASMGELTASIAHEINQPLGAILSNAEAAEMMLSNGSAKPEDLKAILSDIRRDDQRAHDVVNRLRGLLANAEPKLAPLHLHTAIQEVLTLVLPEAKRRGVLLLVSRNASNDLVRGDPVQIQQVLINLVINAMDALELTPRPQRRIHIQTNPAQDHLVLSVADNGCGMDETTQATIFDSLFTTKKTGLGMGLSIVRSIVDAHSGTIQVQSRPGDGSVFTVRLPLMKEET